MTQNYGSSNTAYLEEPIELAARQTVSAPSSVPIPPAMPAAPTMKQNVAARLISPMPGVVVICEKSVGEEVESGDVVLILEAMKMENLITAPAAGKVLSILVQEGEKVERGTVLATIG